MVSMGQDDRATVGAVLAGDTEAYAELVRRHSAGLFRLAWRMTGNRADADDVVQEAFLRGYKRLASFEGRAGFGTWIYRIAVHCALDRMDARRSEATGQLVDSAGREQSLLQFADRAPDPERLAMDGEIASLQRLAMGGLTPIERTAFVLRHLEDKTTEEIAAVLSVSSNAAKQTVFRAVQKVRQRLIKMKVTA